MLASAFLSAVFLKHIKRCSKGINVVVTGACYKQLSGRRPVEKEEANSLR